MTTGTGGFAGSAPSGGRRRLGAWLAAAVAAYVVLRVVAVFSVAGNWDEFVLLERANDTAASGVLQGGGRPGLATLLLVPIAADCDDEISTLRHARLLWLGLTLALLAGLGGLLREVCDDPASRREDVWLGVGLLALVPAFLEWSLQVRSDQLALALALWGGVALLASRRKPRLAAVAGLLLGLGYLATQKAVYVAALLAVLAAGQLWQRRELRPRRELVRVAACAGAFAAVIGAYQIATTHTLEVPQQASALASMTPSVVSQQISEFRYYRNTIGFDQYREILPTQLPHALLLAALVAASIVAVRSRGERSAGLAIAWAVLGVGLCVGAFHASTFAYFWMTLGLFPAVAFAVAAGPIRRAFAAQRSGAVRLVTVGLWLILGVQGVARMAELSVDTQSVQRDSLAFLHRNFDASDSGFHPEHGPFCRGEENPIRLYFSQTIYHHFAGEHRDHHTRYLLADLRARPIKFVLQSFRLNQFPVEVRRFLAENYQPYRGSVFLAGRRLAGRAGESSDFELIVPGRYRWLPLRGPHAITLDAVTLGPGGVAELGAGPHTATFPDDVAGGILVLAVDDPPTPAPLAFYKLY
jgi:hypothetical protein